MTDTQPLAAIKKRNDEYTDTLGAADRRWLLARISDLELENVTLRLKQAEAREMLLSIIPGGWRD